MVNTKERNGSLSLACASPEEPEEPDARVRGALEIGEEDGEVQPMQSISQRLGAAGSHTGVVEPLLMCRLCWCRR